MANRSLGRVPVTAGTPARATANESNAADRYACQSILFQAHPDNDDVVYVMAAQTGDPTDSAMPGVLAVIGVPDTNDTIIPSFTTGSPAVPNGLNAADFWIDCRSGTQAAVISVIRG